MNQTAPDQYKVEFNTSKGRFVLQITRDWSPAGADRFYSLVKNGFYDETRFFRVMPNFIVQWGISGNPEVGPKWASNPQINPNHKAITIPDEPVKQPNRRGTITYAKPTAPNSRTTQVFINLKDNSYLDGKKFAPFGEVIEGLEVVEAFHSGYEGQPSNYQTDITLKGNAFLEEKFPELDYVETARIID
ncbi:MAG: peptidylprolyl isomerase [Candidatus Latescibacteria bacterium]|nr:peptidylprolyl isomerase [Candidatus Latescibacterota bacterium]